MPVNITQYNEPVKTTAAIAAGASASDAVTLPPGHVLCAIEMPAAWDTAAITLQGSPDGTTYGDLYIAAGTELSITAAAATTIALDPTLYQAFRYLKVRSGTSGTPVAQSAACTLGLISRPL